MHVLVFILKQLHKQKLLFIHYSGRTRDRNPFHVLFG